jgi:hypothetical protein
MMTAYREEVRDVAVWCQNNNVCKIVDYRKRRAEQAPI